MPTKSKILTFVSYYLPGYKAGGPLRTIANMVEHLNDDFEFWIVTRDRDLGDKSAYPDVSVNEWNDVGNSRVFYASPDQQTLKNITNIINNTPHDVIYLNSFFDPIFTLKPLLTRRFWHLNNIPIVLAPRGEFSAGALNLKRFKKSIFMRITKLFGLYSNIYWHASSPHEAQDIKREFALKDDMIFTALDLPTKIVFNNEYLSQINQNTGCLRVMFLSRISPMKNLDYALNILKNVTAEIKFDIYGPIEDAAYWQICQNTITTIPENVTVSYCGPILPQDVAKIFVSHDLFLFPTRGENYGHVIAESLSVGTPVLLSDQTPWRNLEADGLGWDIPLNDIHKFVNVIETLTLQTADEKYAVRQSICKIATERLANTEVLEANRQLFYQPIKISKNSTKKEKNV